jgi:flagellar protein FlaJ
MAGSVNDPDVPPVKDLEDMPSEDRSRVKRLQGRLRSYFRSRQTEYDDIRDALNEADMPVTYYDYLAKTYVYAFAAGAVGLVLGVVISAFFIATGVFSQSLLPSPAFLRFLSPLSPVLPYAQALVLTAALGGTVFVVVRYALVKRPYAAASVRRREIETTLPHGIFFMYTLSYGGMDIEKVFRKLADSESQYGELSREFQGMVNDVEYFGTDLVTAMRHTRDMSPSPGFRQFLDDLLTVIDSGGDVTRFLDRESEKYIQRANDEQESFLETLALISEVYLALLIAGPLFILVGLLVVAILGGEVLGGIYITVYVLIPLLSAVVVLGVDLLSNPYGLKNWRLKIDDDDSQPPDDEKAAKIEKKKTRRRRIQNLKRPLGFLKKNPVYSFVVTVPLAASLLAATVVFGVAEPSAEAMVSVPIPTTTWLVLLPSAVVAVPYTVLYEMRMSEVSEVQKRLPAALSVMSNANEIGMSLTESLDLLVSQSGGRLVDEMGRLRNDIHWNSDVGSALARSANRVQVPSFSRVFNLIREANRSSGDLYRFLTIAARDASTQQEFRRKRYQEISAYVTVVVVGFFVYLFVIVTLDTFYVQRVIEAGEAAAADEGAAEAVAQGTPLSLELIPTDELRMAYFHSAVVQAVCAGMISGKILRNDLRAGLKFAIGLSAVALVVFALLV